MANQLVRAVPRVTGIENVEEAEDQIKLGYALSGILIGRKMAKDLKFPYYNGFIALILFRTRIFLGSAFKDTQLVRRRNFTELLGISSYDDIIGISYKLPTNVKDAMSQDWWVRLDLSKSILIVDNCPLIIPNNILDDFIQVVYGKDSLKDRSFHNQRRNCADFQRICQ